MSRAPETRDTSKFTPDEAAEFAEQLINSLLDPVNTSRRNSYLTALQYPIRLRSIMDLFGLSKKPFRLAFVKLFHGALQRRDRKALRKLLKKRFEQDPPGRDLPEVLSRIESRKIWRAATLKIADSFKGQRGFERKIKPEDYVSLATLGDELAPVIRKLLREMESGTRRTVPELLEFWSVDEPRACEFLQRHIRRLDSALQDEGLLSRAKKLKTRARLIADVMAGADYNLSLLTSLERTREGRRQTRHNRL